MHKATSYHRHDTIDPGKENNEGESIIGGEPAR
jgi:hypothetical protein